MPLDLHVLSLPLAFILSQDQTLHCKFLKNYFKLPGRARAVTILKKFFLPISLLNPKIKNNIALLAYYLFKMSNELFLPPAKKNHHTIVVLSECKGITILSLCQVFLNYYFNYFLID